MEQCSHISRAPFVCNGCDKPRNKCPISTKYDYNAKAAHRMYTERLSASREGISLTKKQLHEMDIVKSAKGSNKCILTFYFPETELFLAHLLNRCTPGAVRAVFDRLQSRLGSAFDFSCLFPVILTDRGVEFGNPNAVEKAPDGTARTSIYYCDPMRSSQKGGIENVHTMLRMIIPKGTVFAELTQWDIRRCVAHSNNAPRKALNGSTPYLEACKIYDEETITALQLRYVAPDDVRLTPKLLKH